MQDAARSTARLAWLLTAATVAYYALLLTNGSFDLFGPEERGLVFNSMFRNLARGDFSVDAATLTGEAIVKDGKTYAYFGVFPAALRAPLAPFVDLGATFVARASVLLAVALSLVFCVKTWLAALRAVGAGSFARHVTLLVTTGVLLASPYVLLVSNASLYHEPIVWAAAAASLFGYLLVRAALERAPPTTAALYGMALAAGVSVHVRPNVAVGLYLALVGVIALDLQRSRLDGFALRALGPLAVLGAFGLAYLGVNHARFGDPLVAVYFPGHLGMDAARIRAVEAFGTFGLARVPAALAYYALGSPGLVDASRRATGAHFDWIEGPFASLLTLSPLVLALGVCGVAGLAAALRRDRARFAPLACGLAGQGVAALLTLSYMVLTLRYRLDFWGFASLAGVAGFVLAVPRAERLGARTRAALLATGWLATLAAVIATHLTLFAYKLTWFSLEKPPDAVVQWIRRALGA